MDAKHLFARLFVVQVSSFLTVSESLVACEWHGIIYCRTGGKNFEGPRLGSLNSLAGDAIRPKRPEMKIIVLSQ